MAFVKLIEVERCNPDGGTFVATGGLELAVFLPTDPDAVIVIDNACPHGGGNLSGGDVTGHVVSCKWHYWKFNLDTGVCLDSSRARVRRYEAEIRAGWVWADLP